MARLHALAFVMPRPWSAAEIADLLASPFCFALVAEGGFVMGRVIAGEAELLTIAVDPARQGAGIGRGLMQRFLAEVAQRQGSHAFLEVAETNAAARALYLRAGFCESGRRRGYYHDETGKSVDAIVMNRSV